MKTRAGMAAVLCLSVLAAVLLPTGNVASAQQYSVVVTADNANVRSWPTTDAEVVGVLNRGDIVTVLNPAAGEEVDPGNVTWFRIGGGYIYSSLVRPSSTSPLADTSGMTGRWIEVDRDAQIARAVENGQVVYQAPVTVGVQAYPTPIGRFEILRRVYDETMNSATIGINPDAADGYYLEKVLFTQYITSTGVALHYNHWSPATAFGNHPASHGCIGMGYEDAQYFWNLGYVGMTVVITR